MHFRYMHCLIMAVMTLMGSELHAEVRITTENSQVGTHFGFEKIQSPAINDAATNAVIKTLDGKADANSGALAVLNDGLIPMSDDAPQSNFFFGAGTDGGFLELDLGKTVEVAEVATYSWHTGTRAAQVYRLFGSDGAAEGFSHAISKGNDPSKSGWQMIAEVDSRTRASGGQHGVAIADSERALGRFRYLLLDISPTEKADAFGNTFYSEIDVFEVGGPEPKRIAAPKENVIAFASSDGKFQFTIDVTQAPDLAEWSGEKLRPVVEEWYPKIVDMFPSEGFTAPQRVKLRYLPDSQMRGIPAYASAAVVSLNADWFRRELKREARGAVVHELVHVVQAYSSGERRSRRARTPGWIVEGIPDYVRWFLYEPESRGAEINARNLAAARHDASYRVSANFLNWLAEKHGEKLIADLNSVAREGKYDAAFWKEQTGKSEQELDEEWKNFHKQKIEAGK